MKLETLEVVYRRVFERPDPVQSLWKCLAQRELSKQQFQQCSGKQLILWQKVKAPVKHQCGKEKT